MQVRPYRAAALALLIFSAACGDDDDLTVPEPDAGIATMMMSVAGHVITVDSTGRQIAGEIGPVPLGPFPVIASFFQQDGSPASEVAPERYTFEVVFADTTALDWEPGIGFSGTLSTLAGGSYSATFRLRDTDNNGIEIFYATVLVTDLQVETIRIIVDADTTELDADVALPATLPPIAVGDHPVRFEFIDANGEPSAVVTTADFRTTVNSSDTNLVAWTAGEGFDGTLTGVAPGVASIALRLRSAANDAIAYERALTVAVEE